MSGTTTRTLHDLTSLLHFPLCNAGMKAQQRDTLLLFHYIADREGRLTNSEVRRELFEAFKPMDALNFVAESKEWLDKSTTGISCQQERQNQ